MTLNLKGSINYAAAIIEYDPANVITLPNRDRVVGYRALGFQGIIGKDAFKAGELLVLFPAGAQLSLDMAAANDLHRDPTLNKTEGAKGYLEANRRVKAISLAGNRSDCLIMPLTSLAWAGDIDPAVFRESVSFDHVGDLEVCRKYVPSRKPGPQRQQTAKALEVPGFSEHFDTRSYFRSLDEYRPDEWVTVTQKLHGTSLRVSKLRVPRKLSIWEKIARWFGVRVEETEYAVVVGSRRVTKSINGKTLDGKAHWYEAGDIWTRAADQLGFIPNDIAVFAEVIGYIDGTPIQPSFTYHHAPGDMSVWVYRIAHITADGDLIDLPAQAVQMMCERSGWNWVPLLWEGKLSDLDVETLLDRRLREGGSLEALPLSDPTLPDEGVCIRAERYPTPLVTKAKSPSFFVFEGLAADSGRADIEEEQAAA
jgi:hypothetical protein